MPSSFDKAAFERTLEDLITADPGLPRTNPTTSFWQVPEDPNVSKLQSASLPQESDIVIIGSGVSSCSITKALLESPAFADKTVTVLEARTLVSGATGRNGGNLVSAAGHKFSDLVAEHGLENAKQIVRFSFMNIERVNEVVAGLSSELRDWSELRPVDRVCAVLSPTIWKHHTESVRAFNEHVPERARHHYLVTKEELSEKWGIKGAVGGIGQKTYALWPYRLFTGIFADLLKRFPDRLTIETHTPVISVTETPHDKRRYLLTTPRGPIKASKVIYCTNAYTPHLLPALRGKIYPLRGHMTTQDPGPKLPKWNGTRSWSFMGDATISPQSGKFFFGLYYVQQNAKTGDIFAGTEHEFITDGLSSDDTTTSPIPEADLGGVLTRVFKDYEGAEAGKKPKLKAIWSGVIGMTADGLPLVGCLPQSVTGRAEGDEWIAAGFNGYGMDKCWMTGEALVAMMAGQDVSGWFPKAYLINDQRLEKDMDVSKAVKSYADMVDEDVGLQSKL